MDNFPRTREQFTSMVERNIVPDEVISLKDESENGEFLLKRWYQTNKKGKTHAIANLFYLSPLEINETNYFM